MLFPPIFSINSIWIVLMYGLFLFISLGITIPIIKSLFKFKSKKKDKKAYLLQLIIAYVLSIVIWTGTAYISGYMHMRWLSFILVSVGLINIVSNKNCLFQFTKGIIKQLKGFGVVSLCLILLGVVFQLLPIISSGLRTNRGIVFNNLNSVDGIFHLSLSQFMKTTLPPVQPGAVGLAVTNYHYWSDLYVSEISRIFYIPVARLYFQLQPITMAIFLAISTVIFLQSLGASRRVQQWGLFAHFFAGNSLYIFSLLFHKDWGWSMPAIDHGLLQFFNPPQAYARLLTIVGLTIFWQYMKTKKFSWGLIAMIIFASLFGFKVYWGIFVVLFCTLFLAVQLLSFLRNYLVSKSMMLPRQMIFLYTILGLLSLGIYLPPNKNAGGLFFAPFFWPKLILGAENIDWNNWWLRLQVYEAYHNLRALIVWYALAVVIFLVGAYGSRLIGLIPPIDLVKEKKTRLFSILLWISAIIFTFIGMNTLQTSGGANVFNFTVIALWVAGIFFSFHLSWLEKNIPRTLFLMIAAIIVLLSIMRPLHDTQYVLQSIFVKKDSFAISLSEEKAFNFLRKEIPFGAVVQAHPSLRHNYYETPYVAFMSSHQSYVAGYGILESHNQPIATRLLLMDKLFSTTSATVSAQILDKTGINYLYIPVKYSFGAIATATRSGMLEQSFINDSVIIWHVNDKNIKQIIFQ